MGSTVRLVSGVAQRSAILAASIVAFCLLAWQPTAWLGYIIGAFAVALVGYHYRHGQLGRASTGRVLLACGAVAAYARGLNGVSAYALLVAAALLVAMLAAEALLGRAWTSARILVANLPGFERRTAPQVTPRLAFAVDTGLVVVFGVFAVLALPSWPLLVISVAAAAGWSVLLLELVWLRRERTPAWAACRKALEAYKPAFALYFSGQPGLLYQVAMWLPYLDRLEHRYVVVLREANLFGAVQAMTSAPVACCESMTALDEVTVPSLEVAFYVNNAMKNTHFVRHPRLTHIQLLHGDSDKPPSYHPAAKMYDRLFVAGQAAIDRYHDHGVPIPEDRFDIVGRPQVETIKVTDQHVGERRPKVVLYAPTWTGFSSDVNYCSLPVATPLLRALLARDVTVILRSHPFTSKDSASAARLAALQDLLAEDARTSGRAHVFGVAAERERSVVDCFNAADALISDVSSVVSDFLFSAKPFAITDMVGEGDRFADTFPMARAAYVLRGDLSNLDPVLDELLETDPLEEPRREARAYYLGDFPTETYADAFVSGSLRYL
ncbi:MAG: CDP-glycerol glycerophosphotransferase family protein [Streptosporangiales bacterium]